MHHWLWLRILFPKSFNNIPDTEGYIEFNFEVRVCPSGKGVLLEGDDSVQSRAGKLNVSEDGEVAMAMEV